MSYDYNNTGYFSEESVNEAPNEVNETVDNTAGNVVNDEVRPEAGVLEQPIATTENMEQLLGSFVDILQLDMHAIADELKGLIAQSVAQNKQLLSYSNAELSERFASVIEQQETTIQKQHQAITKFQEDLLYKTQKALILEIIEIADNIRMMLQDQEKEKDYDTLLESVQKLEEWVQATLSNNSVRCFCDTETSATELNRKRQEVIDTEVTNDPTKHNTYVCERPGYIWTTPYLVVNSDVQLQKILEENGQPQAFSYVIRPEEVVKLKYKEE